MHFKRFIVFAVSLKFIVLDLHESHCNSNKFAIVSSVLYFLKFLYGDTYCPCMYFIDSPNIVALRIFIWEFCKFCGALYSENYWTVLKSVHERCLSFLGIC